MDVHLEWPRCGKCGGMVPPHLFPVEKCSPCNRMDETGGDPPVLCPVCAKELKMIELDDGRHQRCIPVGGVQPS